MQVERYSELVHNIATSAHKVHVDAMCIYVRLIRAHFPRESGGRGTTWRPERSLLACGIASFINTTHTHTYSTPVSLPNLQRHVVLGW